MCRASDKCQREKRKTINGDDLLWAMATLGFEDYIDPLKIYLTRYREVILNLTVLPFLLILNYFYCLEI
jgi:nuclear transcription Y subunit beta